MPYTEPTDEEVREILKTTKRIAVVGLSPKPHRASYQVSEEMKDAGYEILPVHPRGGEWLGQEVYKTLAEVPGPIDMVNVYRRSEHTPEVAKEAADVGAKVFWLQLTIANDEAAEIAQAAGMKVVMDRCLKIEHRRLME
ncbi:CoA-binding protein [bacterium]|nr:CoA-binding protein [bacterium]